MIVFSGPSGVGKGTLVAAIRDRVPDIFYSVSATTRPPRPGERDGVDYYFLSREEFERDVAAGAFLEWANIYGDLYGTPTRFIDQALNDGKLVILEIDVQGALQVQAKLGAEAAYIFVMPPSLEELAGRLRGRQTETPERLRKRLDVAVQELELADRYDYVVINDKLERAVDDLEDILIRKIERKQ